MPVTSPGYFVRHVSEAPTVPCLCGESTRPLTVEQSPACSLHVTAIRDSVRHYHARTTEVYYILEGEGVMELNDDRVPVRPGLVILIEPGTWHRVQSEKGIQTIVFSVPAFDAADEFFE
jgi:mannose-6-phosphate isomerase-like protein (cupin superfamily)